MHGMYLAALLDFHITAIWFLRVSPPVNCKFQEGIFCVLLKFESQKSVQGQGHSR